MKKIIFASAVVATLASGAAQAANTTFCAAPTAAANSPSVLTATTTTFIKQNLDKIKCSANVHLVGNDAGAYFGVGAVSVKGKSIFQGSSAGGAVKSTGPCGVAGACTATEANTAATNAPSS